MLIECTDPNSSNYNPASLPSSSSPSSSVRSIDAVDNNKEYNKDDDQSDEESLDYAEWSPDHDPEFQPMPADEADGADGGAEADEDDDEDPAGAQAIPFFIDIDTNQIA